MAAKARMRRLKKPFIISGKLLRLKPDLVAARDSLELVLLRLQELE
jgi:hypothetical protein